MVCTICTAAISPAQYTIESRRIIMKKIIPLTVQPMEGAGVRETPLFLFHVKRFRVRIPGEVNSLYSLRYLQIHYYKHYNKSTYATNVGGGRPIAEYSTINNLVYLCASINFMGASINALEKIIVWSCCSYQENMR